MFIYIGSCVDNCFDGDMIDYLKENMEDIDKQEFFMSLEDPSTVQESGFSLLEAIFLDGFDFCKCRYNGADYLIMVNSCIEYIWCNEEHFRECSHCNKVMYSGYYADGEYYCSSECLHTKYSKDEWEELSKLDECYYHWAEWHE